MSKRRVKILAVIDTQAHANTILNSCTTQLTGKNVYSVDSMSWSKNILNQIEACVDVRFNSSQDASDFRDWAKTQIADNPQVKDWFLSAILSIHQCSHDDTDIKNCKENSYTEFIK